MKSYRDLRVWQQSIDLAEAVYEMTDRFPRSERYGLGAQLRSAAVSIASNLAEGQGRMTSGEWLQFLGHARGSLFELQTQVTIAGRLRFLQGVQVNDLLTRTEVVGRGLAGLINYVRACARRRR